MAKPEARVASGGGPAGHDDGWIKLRPFVSGPTPRSAQAIVNVRKICEDHFAGRYELDVVDLSQSPALASAHQVIAAPTLVRWRPLPERRFIGDMSVTDRLLATLNENMSG